MFQFQPNALLLPFLAFHETTKATETTKTLRRYGSILEHTDYTPEIDLIMNTVQHKIFEGQNFCE